MVIRISLRMCLLIGGRSLFERPLRLTGYFKRIRQAPFTLSLHTLAMKCPLVQANKNCKAQVVYALYWIIAHSNGMHTGR